MRSTKVRLHVPQVAGQYYCRRVIYDHLFNGMKITSSAKKGTDEDIFDNLFTQSTWCPDPRGNVIYCILLSEGDGRNAWFSLSYPQ